MTRPLRALAAAAVLVAAGIVAVAPSAPAHADVQICEQYGSTTIQGRYVVQNNRWGTSAQQCINVTDTGFSITRQDGVGSTSGAPVSYPSVFYGCHYTNCSPGTNLPRQVSQISSVPTSISYQFVSGATYNASFDIWLDPTPRQDGVNQMEIMIWFNRQGSIQPIGSQVGTGTVGGRSWQVWQGSNGSNNVISYVAPSPINSWSFNTMDFINDIVSRGAITRSWYLTSIQGGFEPWIGGVGLGVNSFSATVNGGSNPGDTQAPTTPGQPNAANVTSNSVQLSWSPSSDNVGVTGYDVYRQQGGGQASMIASVTGTSYSATGLSPSTSYGFFVRARDAAGNQSAASPTRTVTTQAGPGPTDPAPSGPCRVSYGVNQWNNGFTANVTITNTGSSTINGWTLTWTFPGNQQVAANPWNAQVTQSGSQVTARNMSYNGTLAPNASTSFGFNGSFSGSNPAPTSFSLNGTACTT